MKEVIIVFAGGGLGAVLRYGLSLFVNTLLPANFPYSTFSVNIIGSFLIGYLMSVFFMYEPSSAAIKLFAITGVLGGFTTFSAFSLEAFNLFKEGDIFTAVLYIVLSVIICLSLSGLGLYLGRKLY